MRLENLTWPMAEDYFSRRDIVILAIGSIESHGRHAALGTDTVIPNRLLELMEEKTDILMLPTIPYGNADWHVDFPGTISIGHDLLRDVLLKVCMEVHRWGVCKFVVVNGHGGNTPAIEQAACQLDRQGALMAYINWWSMVWEINPAWKGGHGGGEETSGLLAVSEDLVDRSAYGGLEKKDLSDALPSTGFRTVSFQGVNVPVPRASRKVMGNGWFGTDDPKTASREWGVEMLQAAADFIVDFAHEFEQVRLT